MNKYAYLFEARGIQRFLFATGKLKDMLAGSELIDYICADQGYLDQVLLSLNLHESVQIPRKAGGAFYLVFEQECDAIRFQAAWRLVAAQCLPSLERVDVLCFASTVKEAVAKGLQLLAQARNQIEVELPSASPITERSPRTGLAAVARERGESIDLPTFIVRQFKRPQNSVLLTDRFLPRKSVSWPDNFESNARESRRFPLGRRSLVGLVHADGNGLGEILRLLNDACQQASDEIYVDLYKTFSEGLTVATIEAAKRASQEVLLPNATFGVMPARPLVLGGDDLSIIVRADLAIPFTQKFLLAFKETSTYEIKKLKEKFELYGLKDAAERLPYCLTACAGVVFMKASQPFYSAYSLAEGLCKQAKTYSRQYRQSIDSQHVNIIPSSLAFYKVTDSVLEDIDAMYEQTQIAQHMGVKYHLSLPAYLVGEDIDGVANLEQLLQVQQFLKNSTLNDRPLREIATLIHISVPQAMQAYRRWRQHSDNMFNADKSTSGKLESDIKKITDELTKLIGKLESDLPFNKVNEQEYKTILGDLLTLFTVDDEVHGQLDKVQEVAL